jgi:hypothetical protein
VDLLLFREGFCIVAVNARSYCFVGDKVRREKGTRQIGVILYAKEPSFPILAFAVSQR